MTGFDAVLKAFLKRITICPIRMEIDTPEVCATVPMLRGVWGSALYKTDREIYSKVFTDDGEDSNNKIPSYIMRPGNPSDAGFPILEQILIGNAIAYYDKLALAWDIACQMGLGKKRVPFTIRTISFLDHLGRPSSAEDMKGGWTLDNAVWPIDKDPKTSPCRLVFNTPLRILRKKLLAESPTLTDLVSSASRRVAHYLTPDASKIFTDIKPVLISASRQVVANNGTWERLDLVRYSGSQKKELDLYGVVGHLDLPDGPGELWPLLAAASWIHVGKATIFGLGHLRIEELE